MLRANVVLQERRANARMISDVNVSIATDISLVFLIKSFSCSTHISFIFLCSAHIIVVIPTADKESLLRRMPPNIAIATLCPKASLLRRLPPNVASATQCLSVAIAKFGGSRPSSDAFSAISITTLICTLHKNAKLICALHKNDFIKSYINV